MAFFDGQGTVFTFNSEAVGGIVRYNTVDGITPDIEYTPINDDERTFLPGLPDFGMLTLYIVRDFNDDGQIAMEDARAISLKADCTLTFSNGVILQFKGYVKKLPIVGDDNSVGTADAVIKIASKVTRA